MLIRLNNLLNETLNRFRNQIDRTAMHLLVKGLDSIWHDADALSREQIQHACLEHPICELLHEDPLTWRAYAKPRGYAGDAVLLDLLYFCDRHCNCERMSVRNRKLLQTHDTAPAAISLRSRLNYLAKLIDRAAERRRPRILSVACGHLREVERSRAIAERRIQEIVALDQDADSLDEVHRCYGHLGVCPHVMSVRALLTGRHDLGTFDVIYAAGLYDYLAAPIASRLTERLFDLLNPGGNLLIANFLPSTLEIGYMETFMDWHLIYRWPEEINALTNGIDPTRIADRHSFSEPTGTIGFLTLTRNATG